MVLGDIHVYIDGICHYGIINKKLIIYDGTITDPITNFKQVGNYQISVTKKGEVYVTVPPTFINIVV